MPNKVAPIALLLLALISAFATPKKRGAITLRANIPETALLLLINEQGEKAKGTDEREFCRGCFFRGFDWRGAQCSASQRSLVSNSLTRAVTVKVVEEQRASASLSRGCIRYVWTRCTHV